jgi:hypothetical protein
MLHSSLPRFNFDETNCGSWSHLCKVDSVLKAMIRDRLTPDVHQDGDQVANDTQRSHG